VFTPERWAAAFINAIAEGAQGEWMAAPVAGMAAPASQAVPEDAAAEQGDAAIEEGLDLLRVLAPCIQGIHGSVSGTFAAAQLEKMIRKALPLAGAQAGSGKGIEIAVRFILLLVKKNLFRHIDAVITEIENELNHLRGILPVALESALPAGDFQDSLTKQLMEKTGAKGIKLDTRLVPELLGGYRLRIGGEIIDASLRSQLQQMSADLATAVDLAAGTHGGF
jgi:F-type H+-transporting ATPase subunit delta